MHSLSIITHLELFQRVIPQTQNPKQRSMTRKNEKVSDKVIDLVA